MEQLELISSEQFQLLKQLEKYEPIIEFHSLIQNSSSVQKIRLYDDKEDIKQSQQQQQYPLSPLFNQSLTLSKSISIKKKSSMEINRKQSSISMHKKQGNDKNFIQTIISIDNEHKQDQHHLQKGRHSNLHFLSNQLQKQTTPKYLELKKRLLHYKQQSQRIYLVSQFINSYQENFKQLNQQKQKLLEKLKDIKGETTELVEKQKRMIDMSMTVKQALDYYTYYSKNQFNYACEIQSRQLFEDNLQSTLSTVMDAIEFFTENETYVQSKKHLNFYMASKSKILSFIKSFFIKLLNKENAFIIRYIKQNAIDGQMNTLYPKSKLALINSYLLTFPLIKKHINQVIKLAKSSTKQQQQEQVKYFEQRQIQIEEFILSLSNVGLIKYLQNHNYEIYSEVMLNLFTFNRFNFHQNFIFHWGKRGTSNGGGNNVVGNNNSKGLSAQIEKEGKYTERQQKLSSSITTLTKQSYKLRIYEFRSKLQFIIQTITSQYLYIQLTCYPSTPQSVQLVTSWLYKLVFKYMQTVVRQARELLLRHKIDPFQICSIVTTLIDHQLKSYFNNLEKEQYHSYIIGALFGLVSEEKQNHLVDKQFSRRLNEPTVHNSSNRHSVFLKDLFANTLKAKLLNELSTYCYQNLPKFQLTNQKSQLQQIINQLIQYIPKLQYCPKEADNYLISSLDVVIKSIKQINLFIESRFECYAWNLIAFGKLKTVLNTKKLELVSKQIRLDFNQSLNIIDRVKRLQRPQSLIQYAQDIFNVIKTGIPSLNQLTLDYNKYINEHYEELESRFLKDILFIYAKNIIEFLQKVIDIKKRLHSQNDTTSRKHLQGSEQSTTSHEQLKDQKDNNLQGNEQKSVKYLQKSPKNEKKHINQLSRLCETQSMRSLYNSYLLSIQKYIKQSKEILQVVEQCRIQSKSSEVKNINNLIREVYEKLFDFMDTFYITVSQFNSQVTAEFEEIAVIKQKQQTLWLEARSSARLD